MRKIKLRFSDKDLKIILGSVTIISVILIAYSFYRYEKIKQKVARFQYEAQALQSEDNARALGNKFLRSLGD